MDLYLVIGRQGPCEINARCRLGLFSVLPRPRAIKQEEEAKQQGKALSEGWSCALALLIVFFAFAYACLA